MKIEDITMGHRVTDDRHLPAGVVGYSEGAGYAWLVGINYGGDGMTSAPVAVAHDIDGDWPGRSGGCDHKLAACIELARQALADGAIDLNTGTIYSVDLERVMDDHHILSGVRILVTTTRKVIVASEPMWASDLTQDEFGMHGALNTLWVVANAIHDLMAAFDSAPR